MLHLVAGIAWDPQLRGFLAVLVGVVVLMGSVYLLLGTNLGSRLGFLVALSALFGWCTLMGLTWWIYGTIGMLGEAPKWEVKEVVYTSGTTDDSGLSDAALEKARDLDTSALPPPAELKSSTRPTSRRCARRSSPPSAVGSSCPSRTRASARRRPPSTSTSPRTRTRSSGSRARRTTSPSTRSSTGGKEGLPEDPTRLDRIRHEAQEHVLAGAAPARTTPSSRSSR